MSLKTNRSTVFRLFGAGVKSFRLTCEARQVAYCPCMFVAIGKVLLNAVADGRPDCSFCKCKLG